MSALTSVLKSPFLPHAPIGHPTEAELNPDWLKTWESSSPLREGSGKNAAWAEPGVETIAEWLRAGLRVPVAAQSEKLGPQQTKTSCGGQ